jgi:receptor-type tyrosine-protein phosphatase R
MITKLVEGGRAKCESYLPEENGGNFARYGRISVHVDKIDEHDGYIVRRLTLKVRLTSSCPRLVDNRSLRRSQNDDYPDRIHGTSHYWYSDWPDHKTPDNPRTLVDMAIAVESLRRSAGNGSPGSASEAQDEDVEYVLSCKCLSLN